ncbi:hypothetical protein ACOMHN_018294 [Nucella lapillus]
MVGGLPPGEGGPPWEEECRQGEEDLHGRRNVARGRRSSMGGGSPPGATRGGGPSWEEDCRQGEEDRHGRRVATRGHQGEEDRRQGLLGEEDLHGRRNAARGHQGEEDRRQGPLGEEDLHGRRTAARGRRTATEGGSPPGDTRVKRIAAKGRLPPRATSGGGMGGGLPPGATRGSRVAPGATRGAVPPREDGTKAQRHFLFI